MSKGHQDFVTVVSDIVFDRFHIMKGVNEELNKIRRECGGMSTKIGLRL